MEPTRPSPAPTAGRHRRPPRRAATAATLLALAGVVAGAVTAFARDGEAGAGCHDRDPLDVRAAAEIAPAIRTAASFLPCSRVVVTVASPDDVARQPADAETGPDVWVPDSSSWLDDPGRGISIASSPVVLAVPAGASFLRGDVTLERLAQAAAAGDAHVVITDPAASAATRAAVVTMADALGSTPTQRGALVALLRRPASPGAGAAVRPSTEQQVWQGNDAADQAVRRAVYLPGTRSLDYPYVVTSDQPQARRDAASLLRILTGAAGRAVVESLGFRSATGGDNPLLARRAGVDPAQAPRPAALGVDEARAALELLTTLGRRSRVLALVDVSGSMDAPVPGAGRTRMQLAREAILEGMALFPPGTVAGLWRFSSDLTPRTNYEQVTPMGPLTPAARRALEDAVGSLAAVPLGGTGLHDSVLAAVRHVRASHDPNAVNTVVVLSDGRNEAASAHGISLRAVLRALRAEADPERPVSVIAVAYGADSDVVALRAIARATGGSLHVARDPRDLPVIVRDAIGGRFEAAPTPDRAGAQ